jgi:MoaA/NifB/PqqE/SkfB family radical SAM enzyme
MGSVRRRPLAEIFRDNPFYETLNDRTRRDGHCGACSFRDYCGGCRARADAYFNRLDAADPGCIFNADRWETLASQPHPGEAAAPPRAAAAPAAAAR